jgi:DNA-binding winged helix-turn-helix (wHTH) protein/TolB-like protein
MSSEIKHLRQFGKFRLDLDKKVLWHEDQPVALPLKEIELLCVLTENGGELVTKNELLERVWSDSFVEESNLSRHIYLLRKIFKDFGENEELIQTVPRRGYRFAGDVKEIGNSDLIIEKHTLTQTIIEEISPAEPVREETKLAAQDSSALRLVKARVRFRGLPLRLLVSATVVAVIAVGGIALFQHNKAIAKNPSSIKSIAILPFRDLAARDNDHIGIGLTDLLITRLSNIKEVKVRPTSAVMIFEDQKMDSVSAGRRLEVDAVLEGTVYRTTETVRVTTRMIRVSDQSPIWARQFEKPLKDELRLQDEIALQVVDALALSLSGEEQRALTRRYTESLDAQQLYVIGRYEWNKRSYGGLSEAQRLFRNAIEKDPNFALAYVGLADSLAFSYERFEGKAALKKALELDPNLAEAHAARGFFLTVHEWNWKEAEASFKRALELNPGYATGHHWYATLLGIEGRYDEAMAEMRRALEINPLSFNFLADLGQIYYFAHEYDKAKEYCYRALEIYPDFTYAHGYLWNIYLQTGEYEAAIEEETKKARSLMTVTSQASGSTEEWSSLLDEWRTQLHQGGMKRVFESRRDPTARQSQEPGEHYTLAWEHALLGDRQMALDHLERAYETRPFMMAWVRADPVFDCLRSEPRYQAILHRMGLAS